MRALTIALLAGLAVPAMADDRVALVIGNAGYSNAAVTGDPVSDADAVAAMLTGMGYAVTLETDIAQKPLVAAVEAFEKAASASEIALVYFAGHGVQLEGREMVMPVDMPTDAAGITAAAMAVECLLDAADGAKTLGIVIIDTSRAPIEGDVPAPTTCQGQTDRTANVVVAFATGPGVAGVAGTGDHSPYTIAILEHLPTPDVDVGDVFRAIKNTVLQTTNGEQSPFTYSVLPTTPIHLPAP